MWCSCVNSDYFILSINSSNSWPKYRVWFLAYIVRIPKQKIMLIGEAFNTDG